MAALTQPKPRATQQADDNKRRRTDSIAKHVLLILFTLTWLLPIFAAVLTSFRTMGYITNWPLITAGALLATLPTIRYSFFFSATIFRA